MKFVGLRNFIEMFTIGNSFITALKNTVIYTITVTIGQNVLGLLIAVLIYKNSKFHNILRTVYFLPAIFSSVAVGFIWGFILDPNLGIVNNFLYLIGLDSLAKAWLGDPQIVMYAIALVHIWVGIGYSMILFITGIQQIPDELYESADIEGANKWQSFVYVTLPLLKSTVMVLVVLTTIGSFKAFDYVFILTGGGSAGQADVLATLVFKEGFTYSRLGYSSAVAVMLLFIVSIISFCQMYLLRDKE